MRLIAPQLCPQAAHLSGADEAKSPFNHMLTSVTMKDTPAYKVTQNHTSVAHMIRGLADSRDVNLPLKISSLQ